MHIHTQLLQARIRLAPSLRVLASNWPVHATWHATLHNGPKPHMRAEELVVLRPVFDPSVHLLPPGGAAFLATLGRGEPLIAALARHAKAKGVAPEIEEAAQLLLDQAFVLEGEPVAKP